MCEDSAALHQPPVNSWHVESSSADVIQEFISGLCYSYFSPESYYLPSWAWGGSKKDQAEKFNLVTITQCVFLLQNTLWISFAMMFYNSQLISCNSFAGGHNIEHQVPKCCQKCDMSCCFFCSSVLWPESAELLSRVAVKASPHDLSEGCTTS